MESYEDSTHNRMLLIPARFPFWSIDLVVVLVLNFPSTPKVSIYSFTPFLWVQPKVVLLAFDPDLALLEPLLYLMREILLAICIWSTWSRKVDRTKRTQVICWHHLDFGCSRASCIHRWWYGLRRWNVFDRSRLRIRRGSWIFTRAYPARAKLGRERTIILKTILKQGLHPLEVMWRIESWRRKIRK